MVARSNPKQASLFRRVLRNLRWGWTVLKESRYRELPMRYVLSHALIRLRMNERVTFGYEGAQFRLFNTPVSQVMFYNPSRWHGAQDIRFLRKLVRSGDTIVDVGANVGSHAIPLAKAFGESTQVHAFEPHPRVFACLQANAALNRLTNLHLYNLALGDREGEVAFSDVRSDDLNRVLPDCSGSLTVPMKPLDSIERLSGEGITLLKIDVEGYELFVLRGAEDTLQRTSFLYLEANTHHTQDYGVTVQELADYLRARGWALYRISDSETLVQLSESPQVDDWENWLAARSVSALHERLEPHRVRILPTSA
jgi:FkbM family methyltransferase